MKEDLPLFREKLLVAISNGADYVSPHTLLKLVDAILVTLDNQETK